MLHLYRVQQLCKVIRPASYTEKVFFILHVKIEYDDDIQNYRFCYLSSSTSTRIISSSTSLLLPILPVLLHLYQDHILLHLPAGLLVTLVHHSPPPHLTHLKGCFS